MDEGRKRVLGIIAGILVARHLKTADDLFDSKESPRTTSMVAAAVQSGQDKQNSDKCDCFRCKTFTGKLFRKKTAANLRDTPKMTRRQESCETRMPQKGMVTFEGVFL